MDQEKINYFKEKLELKKTHLLSELQKIAFQNQDTGEFEPKYTDISEDYDDNLQERINFERDIYVENSLEETLHKVEKALTRIELGKYGFDINTGELIPEARLEVLPEAETIV